MSSEIARMVDDIVTAKTNEIFRLSHKCGDLNGKVKELEKQVAELKSQATTEYVDKLSAEKYALESQVAELKDKLLIEYEGGIFVKHRRDVDLTELLK